MILGQPYIPPRDPHPDEPTARLNECGCGCLHLAPPGRRFVNLSHYKKWQRSPEGRAYYVALFRRIQPIAIANKKRRAVEAMHPCGCGCGTLVKSYAKFAGYDHFHRWSVAGGIKLRKPKGRMTPEEARGEA